MARQVATNVGKAAAVNAEQLEEAAEAVNSWNFLRPPPPREKKLVR